MRILGVDPGLRITGYGAIERRQTGSCIPAVQDAPMLGAASRSVQTHIRDAATTQWGILNCRIIEAGVITPPTKAPLERRLHDLHEQLLEVIDAVRPDVMVVEALWSSYKNPTTAIVMGHARGVLCLAAYERGVEVRHLEHSLVKRALTGSGAARKEQVKRMVVQQLRLSRAPHPNDVSDALALALALANRER